jgi:hypothetical protein
MRMTDIVYFWVLYEALRKKKDKMSVVIFYFLFFIITSPFFKIFEIKTDFDFAVLFFLCQLSSNMANNIDFYVAYCLNNYRSFDLLDFYDHFKFGNKESGEKAFKKTTGRIRREYSNDLSTWANTICNNKFEVRWITLVI